MARVTDERPIHERIAADIRAKIMSGELSGRLAPIKELKEKYNTTSHATMQRAIALLREEGFVESRQGAATMIRTDQLHIVVADGYLASADGEHRYKLLTPVEEIDPPADVAEHLLVPLGGKVVLRRLLKIRTTDDSPAELVHLYFPAALARGTALAGGKRIPGGVPAVFDELGIRCMPGADLVTARPPTTEELELLELPMTVPVLRTFRVVRSTDGVPVEVEVLIKGGHRFGMQYPLPAH